MNWAQLFNTDTLIIALVTITTFTLLLAAEMLWPRQRMQQPWLWRWVNNLSLGGLTWFVAFLGGAGFSLLLSSWTQVSGVGLFQQYEVGFWLPFISLLVASQFLDYVVHRAYHEISWLWPLHAVHHSDVEVDCSTSYRHHPLEPLVFMPMVLPLILLLGVGPVPLFAFYLLRAVLTVFSHSNVYLPAWLDGILRYLIVTPDYHRLHHASAAHYTNSNYGTIFPWFDYLFGTARRNEFDDQATMELGLEYHRERRDSRIDQLIFNPPRPPA